MATLQSLDASISRQQLARALKQRMPSFAVQLYNISTTEFVDLNALHLEHRRVKGKVNDVLREYADVFPDELPAGLPPKRNHELRIQLAEGAKPHRSGIYRLLESELVEIKKKRTDMTHKVVIHPSSSPWGSSVFFAVAKDGSWRM